jgi:hypothetical protein
LKEAAAPVLEEGKTTCCCARSEKSWTLDAQGVSWETFLTTGPHHRPSPPALTTGESMVYGMSTPRVEKLKPVACCRPGKPAS